MMRAIRPASAAVLSGLFLILVPLFVAAGDGVREINSVCVSAGCFSGDSGGFPVEITQPGSYRLTSNLEINQNTTAIRISADDVTLDLNGFAVRGPATCSTTSPPTCISTGIGNGIESTGDNSVVTNGSVSGSGSDCVELDGASARVADLSVLDCPEYGIYIVRGLVDGVTVARIAGTGIGAGSGGSVAYVRDSYVRSTDIGVNVAACDNVVIQFDTTGSSCTTID